MPEESLDEPSQIRMPDTGQNGSDRRGEEADVSTKECEGPLSYSSITAACQQDSFGANLDRDLIFPHLQVELKQPGIWEWC
jgi:hypothetical protein